MTIYLDIIFNLSMLVALSIVSGFIERRWSRDTRQGVLLQGFLFGATAVMGMLCPLNLGPGLIFDGRSVVVSLCALFFGPWAATVSGGMAIVCRIAMGGVGALVGVLVILSSAGIGLLGRFRLKPDNVPPSTGRLYLFGIAVHMAMLAMMLALPEGMWQGVLRRIGLPVMLTYPLATILAGKILSDQVTAIHALGALKESRQHLAITLKSIGDALISTNRKGEIVFMNPVAEALTGWTEAEAHGKPLKTVFHVINEVTGETVEDPVARVLLQGAVVGLANHTLLIARDGTRRPIADSASPIRDGKNEITGVVLIFRDQSKERWAMRMTQTRLALIEYAATHPLDKLLTRALDEIGTLVESPIGFYHVVEADQKTLSLQQWSTRTLEVFCRAEGKGMHYPIEQAGVWADCARQKKPIIHNDYASLQHKQGLPEGHAQIIRELVVPVLREGRVYAIVGVGNKPVDYTETDVEVVAFLADVIWEIAERKKAEEARQASERQFRIFFDNAPIGKSITAPDGKFLNVNPAFAAMIGLSVEEMKSVDFAALTHPDDLAQSRECVRGLLAGESETRTMEKRYITKDGRPVWAHVVTRLHRDDDGTPLYFFTHIQDITRRKQAEMKSRQLSDIIEKSLNEIYVFDSHTLKFRYANQGALKNLKYTLEEIRKLTPVDLKPEFTEEAFRIMIEPLPSGAQETIVIETLHQRADGSLYPVEICLQLIEDGGERVFLAVAFDISERKKTEQERETLRKQLQQAQKMESIGRLAGGVAHDYNNMLGVILGFTELALEKVGPAEPLHADLTEIFSAAKRSARITRQLLAFARKQTIAPQVLDINETVEGMLKMLRRLIGEDIDLAWMPGSNVWPVKIDPSQVEQILANLCVNARDAIDNVGKVTIETDLMTFDEAYCAEHAGFVPGEFVLLAVSDDGCGMDKKTLENIFEPFFTTKGVNQGTGLGLATVYGIVKQSNGFINVYSEPGTGTTFRIYLPRHMGEMEKAATQATKEVQPRPGRGERILLVEDETSIRNMSQKMLEKLGYQVLAAATPGEALRLAQDHPNAIDLLFTDVVMPEMNGRELANQMHGIYPDIKILFMSGYTANVIAHRGVVDEGIQFIQKPFSMTDLGLKVRAALD